MSISSSIDSPNLDLAIKGSLPVKPSPAKSSSPTTSTPSPSTPLRSTASRAPPAPPGNPLDNAPSSPSQVYLNLLILEASMRTQYLHHLARRRKFTFFLILLFCWIVFFVHRIYGLGGSPYYYVSHLEWLGLLGGTMTGALYYATGLYQKTIVEPRRFVYTANRGLRDLNIKLVKVPFSTREWITWWWNWYTFHPPPPPCRPPSTTRRLSSTKPRRLSSTRRPVPPVAEHRHMPSLSSTAMGRSTSLLTPHLEEATEDDPDDEVEEFLPGGLHLKLVILPKRFSANFREEWELYRTEYWDRENEARAIRRRDTNSWRWWPSPKPKPKPKNLDTLAPPTTSPAPRVRRGSMASEHRSPSVSSRAGTPEPETLTLVKHRGSVVAKRRPNMAPGLAARTVSDVSDSGSATTERRSESPFTDRSSSSAGTGKRKTASRGRGRGKKSVGSGDG